MKNDGQKKGGEEEEEEEEKEAEKRGKRWRKRERGKEKKRRTVILLPVCEGQADCQVKQVRRYPFELAISWARNLMRHHRGLAA